MQTVASRNSVRSWKNPIDPEIELFIAFCAIFILPVHTAILKHMDTPSEAFLAHEARSGDDAAYKSFIANSKLHMWAVNDGVRLFIRCVVDAGVQHTEDEWPRVWAGDESRIVNCAMWVQNEDTTFTLVAVWAVSTVDGSTKVFAKEAHREGALTILELTGGGASGPAGENQLVDPNCYDAFMCSHGDAVVEKFLCPALDSASPVE